MGAGKGKILLAEDDADQREILSEFLSREGFEVRCAATSKEVLEQLEGAPDLVLLDVIGVVTPEVLRCLDELPSRPAVVLVSADTQLTEWANRLRAEAQVSKPFDLYELLATMTAVLRGRSLAHRVLSHTFA
ncbi:MAG: response regulator transcription factor [Myxococcaceae bacterium]